jgi:orotidine-5'-phosphate decarboxylase
MKGLAPRDRLSVALDVSDVSEAERLVERIGDATGLYKIGTELPYGGEGFALVRRLAAAGVNVFPDLKLHDIPNTVERAVARPPGSR